MPGHPDREDKPVTYTCDTYSYYKGGAKNHTIQSLKKTIAAFEESLYLQCIAQNDNLRYSIAPPNTVPEIGKLQIKTQFYQSLRQIIYPPLLAKIQDQQLHLRVMLVHPEHLSWVTLVALRKHTTGRGYRDICKEACFTFTVSGLPWNGPDFRVPAKEQRPVVDKLRQSLRLLSQKRPIILGNGYAMTSGDRPKRVFQYEAYFGLPEYNNEHLADMFDLYFDILTPAIPRLAKYINSIIDRVICQDL